MFLRNEIKTRAREERALEFDKFALNMNSDASELNLGANQTKVSYNFCGKTGALGKGYGVSKLALPETISGETTREIEIYETANILGLWHFKYFDEINQKPQERLMWFNADGYLVYCELFSYDPSSYEINDIAAMNSAPIGMNLRINDVDYMIFSHDDGVLKLTQNTKSVNSDFPLKKFVSITNAYGGIYAINDGKRNKITYSHTNLDPTTWGFSEEVLDVTDERGGCNKLLYFNDYLYAFRDYGITKISKYSASSDFATTNLFYTASKIYAGTVAQCGDYVVFLARDGIYNFNGNSTRKFELDINSLLNVDNSNATACYSDGKYYLACKLNFDDNEKIGAEDYAGGYTNNALIVLDLETGHACIMRGVDIHSLLGVSSGVMSKVIACFNGEHSAELGVIDNSGKLFGTPLKSVWRSVKTDLDAPEKDKILKEIFVKTSDDIIVTITSDLMTREVSVGGGNRTQKLRMNVRGKEFKIEISSSKNAEIEGLKVRYDIYKN